MSSGSQLVTPGEISCRTRDSWVLPTHEVESNSMLLSPSCAAVLLSAGADPTIYGLRGIPPLARSMVSISEQDTSLLELYLAHGAKLEPSLLFDAVAPASPRVS